MKMWESNTYAMLHTVSIVFVVLNTTEDKQQIGENAKCLSVVLVGSKDAKNTAYQVGDDSGRRL